MARCRQCNGQGKVRCPVCKGDRINHKHCSTCGRDGYIVCPDCGGTGGEEENIVGNVVGGLFKSWVESREEKKQQKGWEAVREITRKAVEEREQREARARERERAEARARERREEQRRQKEAHKEYLRLHEPEKYKEYVKEEHKEYLRVHEPQKYEEYLKENEPKEYEKLIQERERRKELEKQEQERIIAQKKLKRNFNLISSAVLILCTIVAYLYLTHIGTSTLRTIAYCIGGWFVVAIIMKCLQTRRNRIASGVLLILCGVILSPVIADISIIGTIVSCGIGVLLLVFWRKGVIPM